MGGSPRILNNRITNNFQNSGFSLGSGGGGILVNGGSSLIIAGNTISNNITTASGGRNCTLLDHGRRNSAKQQNIQKYHSMATQGLAGFDDLEAGLAAGLICLGVAYASVLIFGVPTVWLLRRLERFDPIHICVISAVEGAMVLNVLAWTTGRRFSTVLWTAFVGAILGLITGVVVAVAGRPARSPKSLA